MRWLWIDRTVEFSAGKRLVAVKNVSLAEEYLSQHLGDESIAVMPASLMIEGMAQTAGILVGSVNHFREKVILAKIVHATIDSDVVPGDTIRYEAELERMESVGASTIGIIQRKRHVDPESGEWDQIGKVDLMFSHLDQNMAGAEFPKENFVFSDNFRMILESSGIEELAKTAL